jgi:O-antigen ligase
MLYTALSSQKTLRRHALLISAYTVLCLYATYAKANILAAAAGCVLALGLYALPALQNHLAKAALFLQTAACSTVLYAATHTQTNMPPPSGSWAIRPWIWSYVINMWQQQAWFGIGLGRFKDTAPFYSPSAHPAHTHNAHNSFLHTWAETGLLGACAWTYAFVCVCLIAQKAWSTHLSSNTQKTLRLMATTHLATVMVSGWVHHVTVHPTTTILAWVSMGVLMAAACPQKPSEDHTPLQHV